MKDGMDLRMGQETKLHSIDRKDFRGGVKAFFEK
jgi:hypothetical protein